jgi:hypothetical protein
MQWFGIGPRFSCWGLVAWVRFISSLVVWQVSETKTIRNPPRQSSLALRHRLFDIDHRSQITNGCKTEFLGCGVSGLIGAVPFAYVGAMTRYVPHS